MAGGKTVTPHDTVDISNQIDLRKFAPKLRKLGKYLLTTNQPKTIKAACDELKLNYASMCSLIWKEKQKGNDFHQFIKDCAQSLLESNRVAVYNAMVNGAVSNTSTSHNDRKLFLQVAGDLKENDVNINVGALVVGVNIQGIQPQDSGRSKGVLDTEAFIPKGKYG